jgi:hypothetical protein
VEGFGIIHIATSGSVIIVSFTEMPEEVKIKAFCDVKP